MTSQNERLRIEASLLRSWHTWEGRFKSQALLDERALAACLAYVDLNPIRAKMAETPEGSAHTSAKRRIESARDGFQPDSLFPFAGNPREPIPEGIPLRLQDYLELVDWTGRCLREGKRGAIPAQLPPILERLQIDPQHWLYLSRNFESRFKTFVGSAFAVRHACELLGSAGRRAFAVASDTFHHPRLPDLLFVFKEPFAGSLRGITASLTR